MKQTDHDLTSWRQWAGLEVLVHLMRVHTTEPGRRILSAAIDKSYALLYNGATEGGLALDIEILDRLAQEGGWNAGIHLVEARKILQTGRKLDPVAALVAGLGAKLTEGGATCDFLAGVSATQAFYRGEPDALLLRLRELAQPFASVLDLSILEGGPEQPKPDAAPESLPVAPADPPAPAVPSPSALAGDAVEASPPT